MVSNGNFAHDDDNDDVFLFIENVSCVWLKLQSYNRTLASWYSTLGRSQI